MFDIIYIVDILQIIHLYNKVDHFRYYNFIGILEKNFNKRRVSEMDFLNEMGLIPNYRKKDIALFNVDCLKLMEEMKERLY